MNPVITLKNAVGHLPRPIAGALVYIPFSLRLGPAYKRTQRLIESMEMMTVDEKKRWLVEQLKNTVERVYTDNPFYRSFYQRKKYHPERLKSLAHFQDLPIVKKSDLQEFSIEDRSCKEKGRLRLNTGGTSGEPLEFYVDSQAFAREWAHMHWIWRRFGYDHRQLKLTLRGKNLGQTLLRFNAIHNEYIVNAYADRQKVVEALANCLAHERIRWIHGYPSLVADFCEYLESKAPFLLTCLKSGLKGVLLGSEYPAPPYLQIIRRTLATPVISWYGHSEMCILAYERTPEIYVPLYSYGYCESVSMSQGRQHLIGTSYWNTVSPLIRYDTGDGIDAEIQAGLMTQFRITDGRVGDFVIDKRGNRIALTALIFGRHHVAFEKIRHVQVRQRYPGKIELLVVPREFRSSVEEIKQGFDFTNVALNVEFCSIDEPVRTRSGKTPLLIQPPQEKAS